LIYVQYISAILADTSGSVSNLTTQIKREKKKFHRI